jgi:hypothetical protein
MTQHLQKLFLGFFVSAFSMLAFTVDTQAQQHLRPVWDNTTVTGNLPSWFAPGFVRGIAHGTVGGNERVYAADRTNTTIEVMDAATGAAVTPTTAFDLSGVSGGTYPMNDIEVSDDGVIFLGNLTTDATASPFRLYWWTSEGGAYADSLEFSTVGRLGDKFTVVGSVADNTVEIWMPAAGSDPGIIYVATTADQGANWNIETITLSGTAAALAGNVDAAPLALGRTSDFYIAGNGNAPARYSSAGAYVTDSEFSSTSRNGLDLFSAEGKDYLAVYTYRPDGVGSGDKTGMVYVYDVTDATTPTIVGESPLMGPDADSYSSLHGEVEISLNGDGSYNAFALEGVNGLALYTNAPVIDTPSNLIFSEYIEGSGNNKALEITNLSDSTVYLENYQLAQASNGNGWQYYHEFAEGASIEAGGTYVLITDQVDANLFAASNADEVLGYPSPIHFNGNDARALIHIDATSGDTTFTDVFGDPDSSSDWDVAGVYKASSGYTLQRKSTVTQGNTTVLGSFGTNYDDSEWLVKSEDVFNNLGVATEAMGALAGDYFIPQRPTDADGFISLHQALHYVNSEGLSGSTNLFITDDLTETSGLSIHREDLTESTGLTIKPASGVTATLEVISGGGDGIAVVKTDHVTIDGSNEPGGSTRDLTITSADSNLVNMIWTKETAGTTIANTNLTYTGTASPNGIATNESGAKATDALTVFNNSIGSANGDFGTAVGVWGYTDNNVTNTTVANNRLYATYRGIATWRAENNTFIGNTISIDSPSEDKSRYAAIYLALNFGTTNVIGNEIVGLQVNRSTSAGYAAGILFNASLDTVNVFNNTIAADNFTNTGAATGNKVFGIGFDNANGNSANHIYHNTVRIGSSSETGVHAAFGAVKDNSTAQIWDFQNNIFTVEQDDANAFVVYWPIPDVANLQANYNNYYVSGASASIAYSDAAATQTLGDWQTASGVDAQTTNAEVEFVSATDLRLTGASIGDDELAGMPIAFITDDIDGTTRSAVAPYKGAFEGSVELTPMAPISIGAFALLTPGDGASIELKGDEEQTLPFTWSEAASDGQVMYAFHLDSANGDFSNPMFSTEADSNGLAATVVPNYADVDSLIATFGVQEGESITLKWTVSAMAGDSVRFADAAYTITLKRLMNTANEKELDTPQEFSLSQNYPNPFNPTSNIRFTLPQSAKVTLQVFNITGQLVATLANSKMSAGEHTVQFNASNLASGVYIYRMIAGDFVQTKKMTLIK